MEDNDIKMYSTYHEGKCVVVEGLIKTLQQTRFTNVYLNVLNDIIKNYNNTYHRTIKMKPTDAKYNSYAE